MFSSKSILIDHVLNDLEQRHLRLFGTDDRDLSGHVRTAGLMAMEVLTNSNALYHNLEHSLMVTLVGQEILHGKYLMEGSVDADEWVHFVISLLCHDIGYVRGICPGDGPNTAVIDAAGRTVEIPAGATDAYLTPHHIERGKLFVRWRFRDHPVFDPEVIAHNIEKTRFPVPAGNDAAEDTAAPGLVRAADLIGQMADPDYLRKLAALFYEFEETGANAEVGAASPEDLRRNYPDFFWRMVNRHIQPAIRYLEATREGRQWVASLYSHIFSEQHRAAL
ncbi:MAG: metal-dependent phosphohydrolase [Alphaproteobacteria bacterium]